MTNHRRFLELLESLGMDTKQRTISGNISDVDHVRLTHKNSLLEIRVYQPGSSHTPLVLGYLRDDLNLTYWCREENRFKKAIFLQTDIGWANMRTFLTPFITAEPC